jgi:glycosyltransferase involved in cell wall biosynthesis
VVKGDLVFAVPGDLDTPTGGYAYDKRMIAELRALGWRVDALNIGEGFPHPSAATRAKAEALLAAVPKGRPIVIDGLAFGVLPEVAERLGASHPLIALVHHPLALETGVGPDEAAALRDSERAALSAARAVVANSATTARVLSGDYGVPADRITVAPPGTDRPAVAIAPRAHHDADEVALLAVGSAVPRKGYDVLCAALAELSAVRWRLTIAGDMGRDPATAARLKGDIARFGLGDKVRIEDAVTPDRLATLYARADLFVLPSRYEGFGMAFAEAIAHGLPVIGTTAGAIPDVVPPSAGILVPPDDHAAFAAALRRLIADRAERARLSAGARAASAQLPTWRGSAALFSAAIERVA